MVQKLDPAARNRAVSKRLGAQHGVISRWQLVDLGLTPWAIDKRVRDGGLLKIHPGVYAVGHSCLTPRGRWMAAVLAIGRRALLSHRDAAALWNLLPAPQSGPIHVTTPSRGGRARRPGITVHRPRSLPPEHATTCDAVPVTSLARTLYDIAATRSPAELATALHEADHQRIFDLREVEAMMRTHATTRATRRLDAALALYRPEDGVPRLELERRFLALCEAGAIPRPFCNAWVALSEGGGFRPDFWWADSAQTS